MDTLIITKIESFWKWFLRWKPDLDNYFDNEKLLFELDQKIREIGKVSWEIGPGFVDPEKNALVISPGGDEGLFPISKAIISHAPNIEGWEFYSSKPPKKWERKFLIEKHGEYIEIDANDWMYVLYEFPDKTFDIVIRVPESTKLSDNYVQIAVIILLDGELGEEVRLKWIKDIEVVQQLTKDQSNKSNSIKELRAHLLSLIDDSAIKNKN